MNKQDFTHYGWFYGVPVYIRHSEHGDVELAGRNRLFCWLASYLSPRLHTVVAFFYEMIHGEPLEEFMIRITGEIAP